MPLHPSRRAFTLLELLVVVVLIGALAGLASVGVVRSMRAGSQVQVARTAVALLSTARTQAMQSGRPARAELETGAKGLRVTISGRERRWAPPALSLADEAGRPLERLLVTFAASGRTGARPFQLLGADAGAPGSKASIMWVNFDPISGAPALGARKDPQTGEATAEAAP